MAESYINMFKDLGIDTRSADQIVEDRRKELAQRGVASLQQEGESFPGERDLRMGGGAIGIALGQLFNKPKLTQQEQVMVDAQKHADATVDLMEEGGAFGNREEGTFRATEYGETRMEKIAEYLLSEGDQRGFDLAARVYQARQIRQANQEARDKADLDRRTSEHKLEESVWDFERKQFLVARGKMGTIYPRGSNNPNSGMQAFIDDSGIALTRNANGEYVPFQLGEYVLDRPQDPSAGKSGKNPYMPTRSEMKEMRAHQRSIMMQVHLGNIMVDSLATAIEQSPTGTLDIMDGAGKFQIFSTNLANNINSLFSQGQQWLGITDGDPNDPNSKVLYSTFDGSIGSSLKYVEDNQKWMNELIPVPEGIKAGSVQAQRYQAAIVQMAYAKARSNEPGARQLSDHDFKNAIAQIGAAATQPEALRQIMLDNIGTADKDFQFWRKQYSPEIVNEVIPPAAMAEYDAAKQHLGERLAVAWGTANNPAGALAQGPENRTPGTEAPAASTTTETTEERRARLLSGQGG